MLRLGHLGTLGDRGLPSITGPSTFYETDTVPSSTTQRPPRPTRVPPASSSSQPRRTAYDVPLPQSPLSCVVLPFRTRQKLRSLWVFPKPYDGKVTLRTNLSTEVTIWGSTDVTILYREAGRPLDPKLPDGCRTWRWGGGVGFQVKEILLVGSVTLWTVPWRT